MITDEAPQAFWWTHGRHDSENLRVHRQYDTAFRVPAKTEKKLEPICPWVGLAAVAYYLIIRMNQNKTSDKNTHKYFVCLSVWECVLACKHNRFYPTHHAQPSHLFNVSRWKNIDFNFTFSLVFLRVRQRKKIWHWFEFAIKRQKSSRIMSRTCTRNKESWRIPVHGCDSKKILNSAGNVSTR